MSLIDVKLEVSKNGHIENAEISSYNPTDKERERLGLIRKHFQLGDMNMQRPRREFNDLSVIGRMQVDEMSFNTYQANNGRSAEGDLVNGWKSNAMRPVVRNKIISIAAHATARVTFPKLFAYSPDDEEQKDAATVTEDLMEWAANRSDYKKTQFYATIAALVSPVAIIYTEYCETYTKVKRGKKPDGTYEMEEVLDEDLSGFQDEIISADQLYIENFFENNVQKQGWLILRRVISYDLALQKYGAKYDNFSRYVKPGVQLIYNDANQSFYEVYDTNMRRDMVEEVTYWNKSMDLKLIAVNGVLLTDPENANPRNDKRYPFVTFGYEVIGDGKCFYYKSLAFKMMQDANIINTLYPMIIDGTYLNLMPPMVAVGADIVNSSVIVPGAVTTFQDPNSDLRPIKLSENLQAGMNTLFKVDESINESSEAPFRSGNNQGGKQTAYAISKIEQNAQTILGLFLQMRAFSVVDFGKLRLGDIMQHLTIPDVMKIEGKENAPLVYKTFLVHNKQSNGKSKTRKIQFTNDIPEEPISHDEHLKMSLDVLHEQGGMNSDQEIYKVNPKLYRDLKFMIQCSPDDIAPVSEDLERAYRLEAYDRLVMNPLADQEAVLKDFLLEAYPVSKKNTDKYINKQQGGTMSPQDMLQSAMKGGSPVPELAQGAMPPQPAIPSVSKR